MASATICSLCCQVGVTEPITSPAVKFMFDIRKKTFTLVAKLCKSCTRQLELESLEVAKHYFKQAAKDVFLKPNAPGILQRKIDELKLEVQKLKMEKVLLNKEIARLKAQEKVDVSEASLGIKQEVVDLGNGDCYTDIPIIDEVECEVAVPETYGGEEATFNDPVNNFGNAKFEVVAPHEGASQTFVATTPKPTIPTVSTVNNNQEAAASTFKPFSFTISKPNRDKPLAPSNCKFRVMKPSSIASRAETSVEPQAPVVKVITVNKAIPHAAPVLTVQNSFSTHAPEPYYNTARPEQEEIRPKCKGTPMQQFLSSGDLSIPHAVPVENSFPTHAPEPFNKTARPQQEEIRPKNRTLLQQFLNSENQSIPDPLKEYMNHIKDELDLEFPNVDRCTVYKEAMRKFNSLSAEERKYWLEKANFTFG